MKQLFDEGTPLRKKKPTADVLGVEGSYPGEKDVDSLLVTRAGYPTVEQIVERKCQMGLKRA
jgi:hypothetical protein